MPKLSENGVVHIIALLIAIAAIGLLAFFLIASSGPFKNNFLARLFPKPSSHAFSKSDCSYFASPTGTSSGDGSETNPWDLQTALNGGNPSSTIKAGNNLCLKGGIYNGLFTSSLNGAAGSPITVISAPGEWAQLDGAIQTTLAANVPTAAAGSSGTITVTDASKLASGEVILVDAEAMQVGGQPSGNNVPVNRGWGAPWGATTPAAHSAGAKVYSSGNVLITNGSYTNFQNMEIFINDPIRTIAVEDTQGGPHLQGNCTANFGANNKYIGLIVHDCSNGFSAFGSSTNLEINGSISYNNGYDENGGAAGHGFYLQNNSSSSTETVKDSLAFNNSVFGLQQESDSGNSYNVTDEGVVVFNNGSINSHNGLSRSGIILGTTAGITDNALVNNSYFYQPQNVQGGNLRLGYQVANGKGTITNNYFGGGGTNDVDFNDWSSLTVNTNMFYVNNPSGYQQSWSLEQPAGTTYAWDNNTIYDNSQRQGCAGPNSHTPATFTLGTNYFNGICGGALTWDEWRADSHFDANSTFNQDLVAPDKVFTRVNQADPTRENVIVYNWSKANSVNVDPSGVLAVGDTYELRNVQNYFSDVVTGTYNGGTLAVNMQGSAHSVAAPIGVGNAANPTLVTPATTFPEFGAFKLRLY